MAQVGKASMEDISSYSVPGMLSMVGGGQDRNGSQPLNVYLIIVFNLCLIGFGKVIEGMGTLYKINQLGTPGGEPTGLVQITDSGDIKNNVNDKGTAA
ncbi:hypothetical protein L1987_45563 [Smallanthus sonchifolius]|uniref:Uncharacterized protein n=1 Tax=Smallanthus sonchifolius TaxID=185202 RepID=A0ACB9FWT1_9ASTR|nr:hypothetical protein L1987_45563 [Smallanthus sonchifolius]